MSCGLAAGCGGQDVPEAPERLAPEDYGALPGLRAVANAKLRAELARLVDERATPELIATTPVAKADNVAAGLEGLFPPRQIHSILNESEQILPPGKFEFNPIRRQKAIRFHRKYEAQRLDAREALARPKCDFGIRFTAGSLAELEFVDVVRICGRLEAFQAAESLFHGDPNEEIGALGSMLRLASCLATEKHVVARLEAAFLRTEAFRVLQAVVQDDHLAREHLERLYEMVDGQLADWPDDADAWIGDRALGLHTYEMVRSGELMSLLSREEIEQLAKEGILDELPEAAMRNVNEDELFYLQTMRKIIEACSQPYYARAALWDFIARELDAKRDSPGFPFVAARLLLPGIRKAQAVQAQDRANWEAWALALALATGRKPPPHKINPLTGEKYRTIKYGKQIEVTNFGSGQDGDNPSIIVPNLGGGDQASATRSRKEK